MPQLDPTWFVSQLFWLLVTFVLLYVVLSRKVLPAIQGILAQRQNTIASDISQAQLSKTRAEDAKQTYEKALADARSKAQALTNEAMLAHKAKSEQAARDMDAQAAKKLAEAEKKIEAKKQELMTALTPTAAELTSIIVEKLTSRAPANDKVQSTINQLSKRNG